MVLDERLERARQKVVLALDVDNIDAALDLVERLNPYVGMFKIGLELITAGLAHNVISAIKLKGGKIFYDGKFKDIPNTVGSSSKQAAKLGVKIFNVHASAGMPAMLEAVKNKGRSKVYAVSVLTSFDENNSNIVYGGPTKAKVLQMAREATLAGCDGLICSPQELEMLKACPELSSLKRMTPGIRPAFAQINDQKRVMTPAEAIEAGAHLLVIGRPITKPDGGLTPEEAAMKVLEEIAPVLDNQMEVRGTEIMKIFEDSKAIITGSHIVYTSGKHGEAYVNKDAIYPHTAKVSRLCQFIAEDFENEEIDAVVGPVVGGVSLSQWTAHHLSRLQGKEILAISADKYEILSGKQVVEEMCRFMSIESLYEKIPGLQTIVDEVPGWTDFTIKRGQDRFIPGKRILIVEDILTTGGSVKKVVKIVELLAGEIVGVGALCNRGGVTPEQIGNVPVLKALVNVKLEAFDETDCPYCKEGVPINTSVGKGAEYLKNKR
ncbi:MAG: orotidine-5'-phosphate decarboxylase [Candidatus Paceibacterota bacterium]